MGEHAPEQAMTSAMMAGLLTNPAVLRSRPEVMANPSVVPPHAAPAAGGSARCPPGVPGEGCTRRGHLTLPNVGILPKSPASTQHLRRRILTHYAGNAEGSTLRRTLGLLLAEASRFPLASSHTAVINLPELLRAVIEPFLQRESPKAGH